jgi:putative ABC transport system permease protein
MGASVSSIILLLSNQFARLVLIAFVLSIPVSWYLSRQWLSNFAYQIDLNLGLFLLAGLLAVAIAVLTISYHTLRAANANPVNALRHQ